MPLYLEDVGKVNFKKYSHPKIAIFAGAGLSAESGLSTFRDKDGLWEQYDPKIVCNLRTYHQNTPLVLEFYNKVKHSIKNAEPNLAHLAIAKLQQDFPDDVLVVTTNVDNLLEKAGCDNVLHIHGDCEHLSCTNCFHRFYIGDSDFDIPSNMNCPSCGRYRKLKPGIVLFGEKSPAYAFLYDEMANENITHRIVVGSTMIVNHPQTLSIDLEGHHIYVDANPNADYIGLFDEVIIGKATVELPAVLDKIRLILT